VALAPFFEVAEDFLVGAGEGELVELGERSPIALERRPPARRVSDGTFDSSRVGDRRSVGRREFCAPGFQRNAVAGDGVFDGAERLGGDEAEVRRLVGRVSPLRAVFYLQGNGNGPLPTLLLYFESFVASSQRILPSSSSSSSPQKAVWCNIELDAF